MADGDQPLFVSPGHFYSPIPSQDEAEFAIFARNQGLLKDIPGIDLRLECMRSLWAELEPAMVRAPFPARQSPEFRYYYENDFYSYGDALTYFSILEKYRPRRVIEIGSGFTSALLLDTVDYLDLPIDIKFIEPYPAQLYNCLRPHDLDGAELIVSKIQGVDATIFSELEENDILFIDSSHVAKTGSDLTVELFSILPNLKPGVLVHFHDIFVGFEYPDSWIRAENRAWNECYFLRAFLMYNQAYEVLFFNNHFGMHAFDLVSSSNSHFKKNVGGAIWLRKKKS